MRLLIAEDEVDLAEALTVFFEKNHFSVDAVHNGFDACEYASSGAYDAVILDVMMPKMDGIQVLEKLRQEGVKTPIMMLTAKGQKSDRIMGFNAGADDYLPKPFDPDELLSRVRAILRRSEAYQPTVLAYGDLTLDPGSGNLSCGKSSILSGESSSSMRESVTSELTSEGSFSVCAIALSIHFCLPVSISSTLRLVAMTVMGVFSSWLASVMNCFCCSALRTTGSMARRESSTTSRKTSRMHAASAISDQTSTVRIARSSW